MQMNASQPTSHQNQTTPESMQAEADLMQAGKADSSSEAVTNLRGSSVGKVNTRRVGQVILVITLVALLVLSIVFFVAGVHRNN
jgi:hypothetical protein